MKRILLGLLCLIMMLSCGIPVIPKVIDIKGKPGVYLPLGSPFSRLEEGERLEDYVNPVKIKKMMNAAKNENEGATNELRVYDYWPDPDAEDVQTYAVHYPITEMKRDLTGYMNNAFTDDDGKPLSITIPEEINTIPIENFPIDLTPNFQDYFLNPENIPNNGEVPLFTVALPDMIKLVKEARDGPFGLEVACAPSFHDKLRVKIPAFEIDYDLPGISTGDKLRFVNPSKTTFKPAEDNLKDKEFLEVYVRLLEPCSGPLEFSLIFEWEEALIDTTHGQGSLKGEYLIETSFRDILGKGVHLKDMHGFIYVEGLGPSGGTMTLDADGDTLFPDYGGEAVLTEAKRPHFPDSETEPVTEDLFEWPQSLVDPIELAPPLKSAEEVLKLEYEVKIKEWTLKNEPGEREGVITVDMVILLPLVFIVETPSSDPEYVKLEIGDKFLNSDDDAGEDDGEGEGDGENENEGEGENEKKKDLFGRDDNDDALFSNIDKVTVLVLNFRNTIIANTMFVLLESPVEEEAPYRRTIPLDLGKKKISETIAYEDLPNPFVPTFETLLKKDTGQDYATLKMRHQVSQPEFDFFLAVEARADLNVNLF